jgi:lysophospholipase L1-like esterase
MISSNPLTNKTSKFMKNIFSKVATYLVVLALFFQGCDPNLDAESPSAGPVDFTTYMAVGNSLTAGFSDGTTTGGGLSYDGQINSYPAILARAMQATGKGPAEFNQPLFPVGSAGSGYAILTGIVNGVPVLGAVGPDVTQLEPTTPGFFKDVSNGLSLHNFGVPGIRLSDVQTPGTNLGSPYFERMLPDSLATLSYLQYIGARKSTFFTNWLGNNDILGYDSAGAASSSITSQAEFERLYRLVLDTLMDGNRTKGLIATIPNVTSAPYFTTVPLASVALTQQVQVDALNVAYKPYNTGVKAFNAATGSNLDTVRFVLGANVPVIADTDPVYAAVGGIRPAKVGEDLLLLPASTVLPTGAGTQTPLGNQYVLTKKELEVINTRTNEINAFIRNVATEKGLALFDAAAVLERVKAGQYYFDGTLITSSYVSGGAFSLDGVHPTKRGYALIANEMMKAINMKYGSSLQPVNAVDYPAVIFP